ncbi:hypothetical protein O3P69_001451 [Scylla paramamosain]|uniref:Uncharacterized protein n=1 Tax=Scylla paramamosain TaxID=85552 RepID=A0AAW0V0N4_SCYPA
METYGGMREYVPGARRHGQGHWGAAKWVDIYLLSFMHTIILPGLLFLFFVFILNPIYLRANQIFFRHNEIETSPLPRLSMVQILPIAALVVSPPSVRLAAVLAATACSVVLSRGAADSADFTAVLREGGGETNEKI